MSSQASGATPEEAPQWQPIESVPLRFGSAPSALAGPLPAPLFATPSTSGSILSVNPSEPINRTDSNFSDIAAVEPASQAASSLPASEVGFTQLAEAMSDLSPPPSQEDSLKVPKTQSFSTSPSDAHQQLQREETEFIAPLPLNPGINDPFSGLESEQEAEDESSEDEADVPSQTSPIPLRNTYSILASLDEDNTIIDTEEPTAMDESHDDEATIENAPKPSAEAPVEPSAPEPIIESHQSEILPSQSSSSDSSDGADDIFPDTYKSRMNVDLPSTNLPPSSADKDASESHHDADEEFSQASDSEEGSESSEEFSDDVLDNVPSTTAAMDVDDTKPSAAPSTDMDVGTEHAAVDTSTHTEEAVDAPAPPPSSSVKRAKSSLPKAKRSSDAYKPISSTGEGVSITDKSPLKPFTLPPYRRLPGATRAQAIDLDDEGSANEGKATTAPPKKAKKMTAAARARAAPSSSRMDMDSNSDKEEEDKKTGKKSSAASQLKRRSSTSSLSSQQSDRKPSEPKEEADSLFKANNKKRAASYEALEFDDDDSIDSEELADALPGISSLLRRVVRQPAGSKPPPKPKAVAPPPAKKPKLDEVSDEPAPSVSRPKTTSAPSKATTSVIAKPSTAKSASASSSTPTSSKATAASAAKTSTAKPTAASKDSSASKDASVASPPPSKRSSTAKSSTAAAAPARTSSTIIDSSSSEEEFDEPPKRPAKKSRAASKKTAPPAVMEADVGEPKAGRTRSAKKELVDEAPAEPEPLSPHPPKRMTRNSSSITAPVQEATKSAASSVASHTALSPSELAKSRRKLPQAKDPEPVEELSPVTSPSVAKKRTSAKKASAAVSASKTSSSSRPPVIMSSGLTANSRKYLAFLTDELGGKLENSFTDEVSHLVVSVGKDGVPNRTMKYLEALVRGIDIVTVTWAMESLEQKRLLPVDEWRVKDTSSNTDRSKLFSQYYFILYGTFDDEKHLKLAEVERLLGLAGAKFEHVKNASAREVANIYDSTSRLKPMVICDPHVDINKAMAISMATEASPVKVDWIIDSLHQGRLLESNSYTMVVTIEDDDLDESLTF